MSDVTGLHYISNLYAGEIRFTNTEYEYNNRKIESLTTMEVGNAWIPWCDSEDQFPAHHMKIEAQNLTLYVWQSGPDIRYSHDGWSANAPRIPGNSDIGQSVVWVLDADGKLTQTRKAF